jgi:prepilin-type N-terminal cleavage/methylation domain-containing protein
MASATDLDMKKPGIAKRSGGFTLVELMVAIVIVAVLAGLVFGLAKSALGKSRLTASVQRARDLGVRVEGYTQDNAGILPVWRDSSQDLYWWGMLVKDPKNESELEIFKSPGDSDFNAKKIESTVSYGWNARVVGRSEENGEDGPKRKVIFKNPSQILVLADTKTGNMGLLSDTALPDPKRYNGKAAGVMLDGSGITLDVETAFKGDSKYFWTEEERQERE